MRAFNRLSIAGKLGVAAGLAIGLLLFIAAGVISWQTRSVVAKSNRTLADAVATNAVGEVRSEIAAADAATRALAGAIGEASGAGVSGRSTVLSMVRPGASAASSVMGAWFMAQPDAIGRDAEHVGDAATASNVNGRMSAYWVNHDGQIVLEPETDGSDFQEAYFTGPVATGRPMLTEPYLETLSGAQVPMASIAYPVRRGGELIGVAGLDMSLADLSARFGAMKPLGVGRVLLLSGAGKWIAHPDAARRMQAYGEADERAMQQALAGQTPAAASRFKLGGKAYERLFRPVRFDDLGATWVVVVDVPQSAVTGAADRLAVTLMLGGVVITGLVLGLLFYMSGALVGGPLGRLTVAVKQLSRGAYDQAAPGLERRDEVGAIANALEGFRRDLAEGVRRRAEQEQERAAAEAEREGHARESAAVADAQAEAVRAIGEGMSALAGGDLTQRLDAARFQGATRQIPGDFNLAIGALADAMAGVQAAASQIRHNCAEISRAADDLSARTERQAAGLEETAAALDELTITVNKSAEGAGRTRDTTQVARQAAQKSGQVMEQAVQAMAGIEQSSHEITQIIGVIDEIAFQTNLLALNAGVEAARAGESGKGFAVVASEVRALAQRSAEAAKEIKTLIQSSTGQVEQGVGLVGQTGEALREILGQMESINELVSEIAASAREQATGLAEINVAVNQMDQVTQQNAAMVEETTAASRALADEAGELDRLVSGFKVGAAVRAQAPAAAPVRAVVGGRPTSTAPRDGWEEF